MDNVNNLVRIGTVSSINAEKARARVLLEDRDKVVTRELPIIYGRTLDTQDYSMVKVGEQVLCLFLNNGLEEGFIIGSFYTEKIKPPVNDEDKRLIQFEDGTLIEYNKGEITINATKDINIISAQNIKIDAAVNVNISGPAGVNIGTNVTINGNLSVNGNINASGSIIDTGGNSSNHSH